MQPDSTGPAGVSSRFDYRGALNPDEIIRLAAPPSETLRATRSRDEASRNAETPAGVTAISHFRKFMISSSAIPNDALMKNRSLILISAILILSAANALAQDKSSGAIKGR